MAHFDSQIPDVELQNQQAYQPPSPSHTSGQPEPDMPVPNPLPFLGMANDLPRFKLKLTHYLWGHQTSYPTPQRRLLYSASLLLGAAEQWLITHVDPITTLLPSTWDVDTLFVELENFFGGAATLQSRERDLRTLKQTDSVSNLAIQFQTITHTFHPPWPDHPLIFIFSDKLRESIRFELMARGDVPTTFSTYVAAAIAVEQNQAAATLSRNQLPSRPPFPTKQPSFPLPRPSQPPPPPQHIPMDLDGTRGARGPLTLEERRRRSDAGLCGYCGQPGHLIATCPAAARAGTRVQARSAQLVPHHSFYPPAGYQPMPAGYQLLSPHQGPFPGPWIPLPSPHAHFPQPASPPKNDNPSQ